MDVHHEALKLSQIGNSVGVILPKEVLARLKTATDADCVLTMLAVVSSTMDEAAQAGWIRTNLTRR